MHCFSSVPRQRSKLRIFYFLFIFSHSCDEPQQLSSHHICTIFYYIKLPKQSSKLGIFYFSFIFSQSCTESLWLPSLPFLQFLKWGAFSSKWLFIETAFHRIPLGMAFHQMPFRGGHSSKNTPTI
jgi:hypothetical protein